jgi:hypothetical protein
VEEGNATFEVPRKTLATRACLLETVLVGSWGSSSNHLAFMCGRAIQSAARAMLSSMTRSPPTAACSTIRLGGTLREWFARFDRIELLVGDVAALRGLIDQRRDGALRPAATR